MKLAGKRNALLILVALVVSTYLVRTAIPYGAEVVTALGTPLLFIWAGVTGGVIGRGLKAKWQNGNAE